MNPHVNASPPSLKWFIDTVSMFTAGQEIVFSRSQTDLFLQKEQNSVGAGAERRGEVGGQLVVGRNVTSCG